MGRHYRTAESNREEKRMFWKKQLPYYRIFLSSIPCESRTRLVSLSNPKIYIYAISSNYHVVSFQSNKYLCLSYIYRIVEYRTIILTQQSQIKIKKQKYKKKKKKKKNLLKKKKKKKKKKS